jgi:hypothetical protein
MDSPYLYYLGLDLGQARDYSALAIIEEQLYVAEAWANEVLHQQDYDKGLSSGWVSPAAITPHQAKLALRLSDEYGRPAEVPLAVRHLERFELGTKYTDVVESVGALVRSEPLRLMPAVLLVDKTGVGAAILDAFTHARIGAVAITLHGGSSVTRDPQRAGFRVPKRDLITVTQVLLQNGRLRVASGLPEAETLKKELLNFRVKIDPKTAHDSYEHWRESDHDDLVLAVSMAAWFRQWWNRHMAEQLHNGSNGHVEQISPEEGRELFERQAQRYLKMTGLEFLEAWDAKQFGDPDDSPEVMRVAMLIPLVR